MEVERKGNGFWFDGFYILISPYIVGMDYSFFSFWLMLNIMLFFNCGWLGNIIIIIIIGLKNMSISFDSVKGTTRLYMLHREK
jgi:hypothetical protein